MTVDLRDDRVATSPTSDLGARGRLLLAAWPFFSLINVLVGATAPPRAPTHVNAAWSLGALARLALASVTAITLLLGPGLALRRASRRTARVPLGFIPLPGMSIFLGIGLVVWSLGPDGDPQVTARILTIPVLVLLLVWAIFSRKSPVEWNERWVLGVRGLVFLIGLGRSVWSLGPMGELFPGTISHTIEIGDRPDSRISYFTTTLLAHGQNPFSPVGHLLFYPYTFSDRGPLPGILSAPVALLSGAIPPPHFPDQAWSPFDQQGFMAYRIMMMLLATTALLALYSLTKRITGTNTGRIAVLFAAGTPFFVHDVYFTWPKFVAATMCLLAAHLALNRQPVWAGLLVGVGYLMHPLALLSVPTLLLLIALVSLRERPLRQAFTRCVLWGVGACVGLGVLVVGWRQILGPHDTQSKFLIYFRAADNEPDAPISRWISARLESIGNTWIPLRLPLASADSRAINAVAAHNGRLRSNFVVHFFFQYWNTVPFGVGIVFFPVLLYLLWRLARRSPWVVIAMAVMPFLVFAVYWGSFVSGLMREGLHVWLLTVLVLGAMQATFELPNARFRAILAGTMLIRLVEIGAMLTVTTVMGTHKIVADRWVLTDATAVGTMLLALGALGVLSVREIARWRTGRPENVNDARAGFEPVMPGLGEPFRRSSKTS